jgi:hypothetical protein
MSDWHLRRCDRITILNFFFHDRVSNGDTTSCLSSDLPMISSFIVVYYDVFYLICRKHVCSVSERRCRR